MDSPDVPFDANEDVIGSASSIQDIIDALARRGCPDLTSLIDPTSRSDYPCAGGGFCDVYRGALRDGTSVAIKTLRVYGSQLGGSEGRKLLKRAARELYHWSKLKHPNVLSLMGLAAFQGFISMISGWMDNGNLTLYLEQKSLTDPIRIKLCMDVCAGLCYLHRKEMIHGDLKGANILISPDGIAMITDFGNAQLRDLTLKFSNTTTSRGLSNRWAAPELLLEDDAPQVSMEADVYAYGMTVLEALTGKVPYAGVSERRVPIVVAFQKKMPPRPDIKISDGLWELLESCWVQVPSERPKITSVGDRLEALFPPPPIEEIIGALARHDSLDLTSSIDLTACSNRPYTEGKFYVYQGVLYNGTRVAIKSSRVYESLKPERDDARQRVVENAARELYRQSKLDHPNVLPLMGLAVYKGHISMISGWVENGDLMTYLRLKPDTDQIRLCKDICTGLCYIHENEMIHGGIKAANIMVSPDGVAKVADLGNAQLRKLTLRSTAATIYGFSIRWAAPELLEGAIHQASVEGDVYAYGMTVLGKEALTGKLPYSEASDVQVQHLVVVEKKIPPRPEAGMSNDLWKLLNACWTQAPSERPSIAEVDDWLETLYPPSSPLPHSEPLRTQIQRSHREGESLPDSEMEARGSVGLGLGPGLARGGFDMGHFQSPPPRLGDNMSRFGASTPRARISFSGISGSCLTPRTRSGSRAGVGGGGSHEAQSPRGQRGNNRGEMRSGFQTPHPQASDLEPVAPLEQSENRWVAKSTLRTPQKVEPHQLVERKVKALLNKLTMEKFDSISDQIIEFANKSEQEKDGTTLMQVLKLVFEKAKDEAVFGEMYAQLCRKTMEQISPNVQDEAIRNAEGQPITGGRLFRKYLVNRCQGDFERGWSAKEAALAAAALKAGDDKAAEAASEVNGKAVLYSDEHYAAARAKRQGLGLVRFIGELFKLQMLTERVMHECIKKLLSNVVNPEEEEIESLCKLLTTVGQSLDNPKARNHMDIYFERMQEMTKSSNINLRMQFMLLDVIELRARHWQSRSAVAQPAPSNQGQDKRDDRNNVQRGASRRGARRDVTDSARVGDFSRFGKISKPTGLPFGPSSVFSRKDPKRIQTPDSERPGNGCGPSMDLGPGGSPVATAIRLEEAWAEVKVKEDVKEYLGVQDIDEAIMTLEALPAEYRYLFIDKLVSAAFDGGNKAVVLAEKLFAAANERQVVSAENFERGLLSTIELADDISIDVPKTYEWLARFIIAAGFNKTKTEELAGKVRVEGETRIHPSDLLIKEFKILSSP